MLRAELPQRAHDVAAQSELGERHTLDLVGLDRLGLEALEHHVIGRCEARLGVPRRVERRRATARLLEAGAVEVATRRSVGAVEVATRRTVGAVEVAARRARVPVEVPGCTALAVEVAGRTVVTFETARRALVTVE